eukprot:jgi/Hompol1/3297/HPOL_006457-RA
MRRMRSGGAEESVDRKLIANLIVGFLSASRGDSKRFEILNLISSVLKFSDEEKFKVGLSRTQGASQSLAGAVPSTSGASGGGTGSSTGVSFTDMWISFLLKETQQAVHDQSTPSQSLQTLASPSTASLPSPTSTQASTQAPASAPATSFLFWQTSSK